MNEFNIRITFTPESESGVLNGNENVLGGVEYRIDGRDIVTPESNQEPSSMDYLGMAVQSLLRAGTKLVEGEPGYVAYHEFEAYLVFVPADSQTLRVGVSRNNWEDATKSAKTGPKISIKAFIKEALSVGNLYLDWLNQQDVSFKTDTYSSLIDNLLTELEEKK